jgi:NTE family protein
MLFLCAVAILLSGCAATRPVNPPLAQFDRTTGYRFVTRYAADEAPETLIVLAFSGGGTRAAAFAYGVLEELRRTSVVAPGGRSIRLLDEVDVITGVSGGSFTALAYGLYGEKLFDDYEQRFLKRNVQGELTARFLNPATWPELMSASFGRSEMAAGLYDEILFNGATFADLARGTGPLILASATDISTGSRFGFTQDDFDLICSNLEAFPLSRAAAASSAVPLVLSPVTINNYGGTCGYREPSWVKRLEGSDQKLRPAGRELQRLKETRSFQDGQGRPYVHLVDGGLSDNLGLRGVLETLEQLESSRGSRLTGRLRNVKRIAVVVVNSLSVPRLDWDQHERPPNDFLILLKATGVPIDRYSYEGVELLKDLIARWKTLRLLRDTGIVGAAGNAALMRATDVPDIDVYAIDVSFEALSDTKERDYLNDLPTSFVLPPEAVDRLRRAAGTALRESSEFKRLLKDAGATVAPTPVTSREAP